MHRVKFVGFHEIAVRLSTQATEENIKVEIVDYLLLICLFMCQSFFSVQCTRLICWVTWLHETL
jgi:hypothetical protein